MAGDAHHRSYDLLFSVIRDRLDPLIEALINLLDRSFPRNSADIRGLQGFLLVAMYTARNDYQAIRYLSADSPRDHSRNPGFALAAAPLVRSLADLLFTLVFMSEDLPSHVKWYHHGSWRELKDEFDRHQAAYESLPEWQGYLKGYKAALDDMRQVWGISEIDAADLKGLPYWPIPSRMLKSGKLSDETRSFLQYLNDWLYRALSATTHISGAAIVRQYVVLLMTEEEGQGRMLCRLKSATILTTVTLLLAICSEVDRICQFGRETQLSYLWGILVEASIDAKDLFDRRYKRMLAAK
jgi:hypothetical protein